MADRDSFEQSPYELPPGSTEVVLVRHGASEAAVVGSRFPLVDGHSDPALSEPAIKRVFENESWAEIPGGEPAEEFAARTRAGVERIVAATGPNTTAVAVVHGAVIGELCRQAAASRPFAFVHSDNCSISRIVVHESGRWLLRSFNDISHLTVKTGPAG
jgi:broad specificity phosphatase PhoE